MPKLIVMFPEGESTTVELAEDSASIGRLPQNTIQLDDVACSRRHCQILRIKSGFELTDMKSRNGTKVNGVPRDRHVLSDGDIIEIGAVRITFREQSGAEDEVVLEDYGTESEVATEGDCSLVWGSGENKGKKVPLSADRTTLGRKESNTVVLKDQMVSSYHCEVTKEAGGYVLRDLGSTNGCVVNGENVSESSLSHGARIRLGKTVFVFVDPAVADFEQAMAEEEEAESDWGMMRAQVDMARVKRKRTWNLIVSLVAVVFFGAIIGFVTWKPDAVQKIIGVEDTPVITTVAGNLLPDPSFEGEEAVSWTAGDGDPEAVGVLRVLSRQGKQSLVVAGPEAGWGMTVARCGKVTTIATGSAYRISAWICPDAPETRARIGIEWLSLTSGEKARSRGFSFSGFASGTGGFEEVSSVVRAPGGADHFRVVAAVTGPGSARFDDAALVKSDEAARPAAELSSGPYTVRISEDGVLSVQMTGEYQLWDGGVSVVMKDGNVAVAGATFRVDRLKTTEGDSGNGIRADGTVFLPDGDEIAAALTLEPMDIGATLGWQTLEVPEGVAEAGLSFSVSREWLTGGASFAAKSGSRALGGDTDAADVEKVILGGPGQRLSLDATKPVRLWMTSVGGELRLALLSPADAGANTFRAITDFAEEKKKARGVLSEARAANSARLYGKAIGLYQRVVNEFPYEEKVRAEAQKEGDEVIATGQMKLKEARKLYERAKDFNDTSDMKASLAFAESLHLEYEGHEISDAALKLGQAVGADLAEKGDALLSTRIGSLMKQAQEHLKHGQKRLAALFLERVVAEYPDTGLAAEAGKLLDEIRAQ
ncbi:MAG: FHA domain-containing protein [Planctomycetota bacterium]